MSTVSPEPAMLVWIASHHDAFHVQAEVFPLEPMAKDLESTGGEGELIHQICQGRSDLFYSLIEPYERTVFAIAYSVLNNAADAEEVAQEAFLKALKGLRSFRGDAKFSTWLVQIALNEARARLRQ